MLHKRSRLHASDPAKCYKYRSRSAGLAPSRGQSSNHVQQVLSPRDTFLIIICTLVLALSLGKTFVSMSSPLEIKKHEKRFGIVF